LLAVLEMAFEPLKHTSDFSLPLGDVETILAKGVSNLVPIFKDVVCDLETPVSAFLKIQQGKNSFLFESVTGGLTRARYSFVGTNPDKVTISPSPSPTLLPSPTLTLLSSSLSPPLLPAQLPRPPPPPPPPIITATTTTINTTATPYRIITAAATITTITTIATTTTPTITFTVIIAFSPRQVVTTNEVDPMVGVEQELAAYKMHPVVRIFPIHIC
jgi:anthranilate/para-aminobenzoate synthase component I